MVATGKDNKRLDTMLEDGNEPSWANNGFVSIFREHLFEALNT